MNHNNKTDSNNNNNHQFQAVGHHNNDLPPQLLYGKQLYEYQQQQQQQQQLQKQMYGVKQMSNVLPLQKQQPSYHLQQGRNNEATMMEHNNSKDNNDNENDENKEEKKIELLINKIANRTTRPRRPPCAYNLFFQLHKERLQNTAAINNVGPLSLDIALKGN